MTTTYSDHRIQSANCHGLVSIGGALLNRECMAVMNVTDFWKPAAVRGGNLVIPFGNGTFSLPRITHETTIPVNLLVIGSSDLSGNRNTDPYVGLEENVMWLRSNLFNLRGPTSVSVDMPSGGTLSGGGTVESNTVEYGTEIGLALTITFDLTIAEGELTYSP